MKKTVLVSDPGWEDLLSGPALPLQASCFTLHKSQNKFLSPFGRCPSRDMKPGLPSSRADFLYSTVLICVPISLFYPLIEKLLSTYYVPGTVLGSVDTAVNKAGGFLPSEFIF